MCLAVAQNALNNLLISSYVRKLRKQQGLTLKQVEKVAKVSNACMSPVERGLRNPPHPDILKRLAGIYEVTDRDLLIAAGYLNEDSEEKRKKQEIEQTYEHAIRDPNLHYGTRLKGAHVTLDVKRFIVEMYQEATRQLREVQDLHRANRASASS